MTNNAKVGGILSIISGGIGALQTLGMILFGAMMSVIPWDDPTFRGDFNELDPGVFMMVIFVGIGVFFGVVSTLAIVGGVFALKKKYWGWALAGSIGAALAFFLTGIIAIIFTAMGYKEFQAQAPPPAISPADRVVG